MAAGTGTVLAMTTTPTDASSTGPLATGPSTAGPLDLGRPEAGDVVQLILEDHVRFETLLRRLRDASADRDGVRQALATLHVAHAEAEERYVYPTLRREHAIGEHEAEHGQEEHAEGHAAVLEVLELAELAGEEFDDAVEELSRVLNHHLVEEELTILNPARADVPAAARAELGVTFARARNDEIDAGCGSVERVRALVERAGRQGLLEDAGS